MGREKTFFPFSIPSLFHYDIFLRWILEEKGKDSSIVEGYEEAVEWWELLMLILIGIARESPMITNHFSIEEIPLSDYEKEIWRKNLRAKESVILWGIKHKEENKIIGIYSPFTIVRPLPEYFEKEFSSVVKTPTKEKIRSILILSDIEKIFNYLIKSLSENFSFFASHLKRDYGKNVEEEEKKGKENIPIPFYSIPVITNYKNGKPEFRNIIIPKEIKESEVNYTCQKCEKSIFEDHSGRLEIKDNKAKLVFKCGEEKEPSFMFLNVDLEKNVIEFYDFENRIDFISPSPIPFKIEHSYEKLTVTTKSNQKIDIELPRERNLNFKSIKIEDIFPEKIIVVKDQTPDFCVSKEFLKILNPNESKVEEEGDDYRVKLKILNEWEVEKKYRQKNESIEHFKHHTIRIFPKGIPKDWRRFLTGFVRIKGAEAQEIQKAQNVEITLYDEKLSPLYSIKGNTPGEVNIQKEVIKYIGITYENSNSFYLVENLYSEKQIENDNLYLLVDFGTSNTWIKKCYKKGEETYAEDIKLEHLRDTTFIIGKLKDDEKDETTWIADSFHPNKDIPSIPTVITLLNTEMKSPSLWKYLSDFRISHTIESQVLEAAVTPIQGFKWKHFVENYPEFQRWTQDEHFKRIVFHYLRELLYLTIASHCADKKEEKIQKNIEIVYSYPLRFKKEEDYESLYNEIWKDVCKALSKDTGLDIKVKGKYTESEAITEASSGVLSIERIEKGTLVFIVDMGGGTVDISFFARENGESERVVYHGCVLWGGDFFIRYLFKDKEENEINTKIWEIKEKGKLFQSKEEEQNVKERTTRRDKFIKLLIDYLARQIAGFIINNNIAKLVIDMILAGNGWRLFAPFPSERKKYIGVEEEEDEKVGLKNYLKFEENLKKQVKNYCNREVTIYLHWPVEKNVVKDPKEVVTWGLVKLLQKENKKVLIESRGEVIGYDLKIRYDGNTEEIKWWKFTDTEIQLTHPLSSQRSVEIVDIIFHHPEVVKDEYKEEEQNRKIRNALINYLSEKKACEEKGDNKIIISISPFEKMLSGSRWQRSGTIIPNTYKDLLLEKL
jgi:hypothetical protein